jgi:hypothetical protein
VKESYPNVATVRWIVENRSGAALILDDGSAWTIEDRDRETARHWPKTTHLFVTAATEVGYRLTDDQGVGVGAIFAGFERFDGAPGPRR